MATNAMSDVMEIIAETGIKWSCINFYFDSGIQYKVTEQKQLFDIVGQIDQIVAVEISFRKPLDYCSGIFGSILYDATIEGDKERAIKDTLQCFTEANDRAREAYKRLLREKHPKYLISRLMNSFKRRLNK